MDTHFLASVSSAICGENRMGLSVTRDVAKVTCKGCLNALAVTVLVKPELEIDPPVVPVAPVVDPED